MARPSNKAKTVTTSSLIIPEGIPYEGEIKIGPPEAPEERKHRLWKDTCSFWIKEAPVYIVAS
jgi:hypothetical protein